MPTPRRPVLSSLRDCGRPAKRRTGTVLAQLPVVRGGFPMGLVMTFGEMSKTPRKSAGKTQESLAADGGVPVGTIREFDQAKRDPLFPSALERAAGLGASMRRLPIAWVRMNPPWR